MAKEEKINLDDIEEVANIRTDLGDVSELMRSIDKHGLIEPIIVQRLGPEKYAIIAGHRRLAAMRKLGWNSVRIGIEALVVPEGVSPEEFLILNASENLHRKDISPIEIARLVKELQEDFHLNLKEISARLALPIEKLRKALFAYYRTPEKFKKEVGYKHNVSGSEGKISIQAIEHVSWINPLTMAEREELLDFVKEKNLSAAQINVIRILIQNGMGLKEAMREQTKYRVIMLKLPIKVAEEEKIVKKYGKSINALFFDALKGKVVIPKEVIWLPPGSGKVSL